jgi:uncharacterized protein YndB with AHSA1/START domain
MTNPELYVIDAVTARILCGSRCLVFDAWTKPELLKRWWAPKSTGVSLLSCGRL